MMLQLRRRVHVRVHSSSAAVVTSPPATAAPGSTVYAVAEQDPGAVIAVRLAPDGTYEVLGS
ncbi:hypothetical protein ACWDBC_02540, partial [Streptomyces parvus]